MFQILPSQQEFHAYRDKLMRLGPAQELKIFKVHNVETIEPIGEHDLEFPQDDSDVEVLDENY